MTASDNIINYLLAAIIGLLLVVVVVLAWMLLLAVRKLTKLEKEMEQLEKVESEEEKKIKHSESEETDGRPTDAAEPQPAEVPGNVFVYHIDQLIARNIEKNGFTANTIAQVLHLSRTQLDRRMKQLVGKTTTSYLMDRRMIYARELLLTTDMPIAEVAMACGFEDISYFTRVFRGHYQNTPSEVRKRC